MSLPSCTTNANPSRTSWVLRLRFHKTIVFLIADPLSSLSNLKSELLTSLQQTYPSNKLNGITLPNSPDDFELAVLIDPNDRDKGWRSIESNHNLSFPNVKPHESLISLNISNNENIAFRWNVNPTSSPHNLQQSTSSTDTWDVIFP